MITNKIADRLVYLCDVVPEKLATLDKAALTQKPAPQKWSRQEILGHLIDSAANNHQRFIRVQFEDTPTIFYDQDNWVEYNYYNDLQITALVNLWVAYNRHLAEVIKKILENNLKVCRCIS